MSTRNKWVLGGIGTVVLGALGSGLWSTVFEPLGTAALKALLSIVTLGIAAAKDSVYREAAFGLAERPSVLILVFLASALVAIVVVAFLVVMIPSRPAERPDRASFDRQRRRFRKVLMAGNLFATSAVVVQILLAAYTSSVVAHFHQSLAIITPYISADQLMLYKARFAKVRSRKDFVQLYGELQSIAKINGEKVSEFSPW